MFEKPDMRLNPAGEPQEFIYKGRRFRIHAIVERWRESGGWWKRLRPDRSVDVSNDLVEDLIDDHERKFWRVEAAQIGALATFEIEHDEESGEWLVRPASRPSRPSR